MNTTAVLAKSLSWTEGQPQGTKATDQDMVTLSGFLMLILVLLYFIPTSGYWPSICSSNTKFLVKENVIKNVKISCLKKKYHKTGELDRQTNWSKPSRLSSFHSRNASKYKLAELSSRLWRQFHLVILISPFSLYVVLKKYSWGHIHKISFRFSIFKAQNNFLLTQKEHYQNWYDIWRKT